jgi:hypothetical protein
VVQYTPPLYSGSSLTGGAVFSRRACRHLMEKSSSLTDKKNKIFLIYKEIQNEVVAKSYMTNGLLIYGEIFAHFLIY